MAQPFAPFVLRSKTRLPCKLFLTPELIPDEETLQQLDLLASTPGLVEQVVALPDLHWKAKNMAPTGTAIASQRYLVPNAVDTGVSCGMRVIATPLQSGELEDQLLDELFHRLKQRIPCHEHCEPVVSLQELEQILLEGARWLERRYGWRKHERQAMEEFGIFPVAEHSLAELPRWLSPKVLQKGRRTLGTLGDGNHFLELQEVVEIVDPASAARLGLEVGQLVFMLHTGSRNVGSKVMKSFLSQFRNSQDADLIHAREPFLVVNGEHPAGQFFLQALAMAANFAVANRSWITQQVRQVLQEQFGVPEQDVHLLVDSHHVSIKQEHWNGQTLFIHRHGASYAPAPSALAEHPLYSGLGQPLPVPGSMGHESYLAVSREGTSESFHSVNHGAGRVLDKPQASRKFSAEDIQQQLASRSIRLYRYGTDNIAEQAPQSFKDISQVIQAMEHYNLARAVARLRPRAVLKG